MAATNSTRNGLAENIVSQEGIGYSQFIDASIVGLKQIKTDLDKFSTENEAVASALEKVEKNTGLNRDLLAKAVAGIVSLYLIFGDEASIVCNVFIGTVYPALASLLAFRNNDSSQDVHWLSYWSIFGGLLFFDSILFDVPAYYFFKAIVLLALMLPQIRGSELVYEEALKRGLLEPLANREAKDNQQARNEQREQPKSARTEPTQSFEPPKSARTEPTQSFEPPKSARTEPTQFYDPPASAREEIKSARSEPMKSRKKSIRYSAKPLPPKERVMLNEWDDFRVGDPFPTGSYIKALFRPLNTLPGEDPNQYISLWYTNGEPVMGRVWNLDGRIAADFGWFGNEYRNNIGAAIQLLVDLPENVRGFDYSWKPFPEAASFEPNKEWDPVHVDHWKGNISPGVMIIDGQEILGKVDVRNERASYGYNGAEQVLVGPAVHPTQVLCRKARPGCKFD